MGHDGNVAYVSVSLLNFEHSMFEIFETCQSHTNGRKKQSKMLIESKSKGVLFKYNFVLLSKRRQDFGKNSTNNTDQ